jgi:hypothetical protein
LLTINGRCAVLDWLYRMIQSLPGEPTSTSKTQALRIKPLLQFRLVLTYTPRINHTTELENTHDMLYHFNVE